VGLKKDESGKIQGERGKVLSREMVKAGKGEEHWKKTKKKGKSQEAVLWGGGGTHKGTT